MESITELMDDAAGDAVGHYMNEAWDGNLGRNELFNDIRGILCKKEHDNAL
jgi:hypothetical protein